MARIPTAPTDLADIPSINARNIGGQVDTPQVGNRTLGPALESLGQSLQKGADVADDYAQFQRQQSANNLIANTSFTKQYLDMRTNAPLGASGFTQDVGNAYDQYIQNTTGGIADPAVRNVVKQHLLNEKMGYLNQAADFEKQSYSQAQRISANTGIQTSTNDTAAQVKADPANAMVYLHNGWNKIGGVIDTLSGVDAPTKAAMMYNARSDLARSSLHGLLQSTNSYSDVQNFSNILQNEDVKKTLEPSAYSQLQNSAWVAGKHFLRQEGAVAMANVNGMSQQLNNGLALDDADIKSLETSPAVQHNPLLASRLSEVKARNLVVRNFSGASLSSIRAALSQGTIGSISPTGPVFGHNPVPPSTVGAIQKASSATGASPDYLAAIASGQGSTPLHAGEWGNVVKQNADAFGAAMHPPISGQELLSKGDDYIGSLQKDPQLNLMGSGFYYQQTRNNLQGILGHPPSDADVYIPHVLGIQVGNRFMQTLVNEPDTSAKDIVGDETANANKDIYFDSKGQPVSVQQAYNNLGAKFSISPGRAAFLQYGQLQRIGQAKELAYRKDPAQAALNEGAAQPLTDDPTSWVNRGKAMTAYGAQVGTVGLNGRRLPPPYPLTNQEATTLSQQLSDPNIPPEKAVGLLANIQKLGDPRTINMALKQVGERDRLAAFTGGLMNFTGDSGTARDILAGRTIINQNRDQVKLLQMDNFDHAAATLNNKVGSALQGLGSVGGKDGPWQDVLNAAKALYASRMIGTTATSNAGWDQKTFENCIDQVLGSTPDHKAIDTVNNRQVLMPSGVTAGNIEDFLENATSADLSRVSSNGQAPAQLPGPDGQPRPIPQREIQGASVRALGGGYYAVILAGGKALGTYNPHTHSFETYRMKITPDTMLRKASGFAPQANSAPALEEQLTPAKVDEGVKGAAQGGEPQTLEPGGMPDEYTQQQEANFSIQRMPQ